MRRGLLSFLRPAEPLPPIGEILQGFESLGDNCEFGIVQRLAGLESLGLFRFASARHTELIHALDSDFAQYGAGDDLELRPTPSGILFCHSRRYGFAHSTGEHATSADAARVLARERTKVAYLKRRLLEDLEAGEKILVRKGFGPDPDAEIDALERAIRRHGPSPLLCVLPAGEGRAALSVAWRSEGVAEGFVPRLAAYEAADRPDLGPWLELCANAHRLIRDLPGHPSRAVRTIRLSSRSRPQAHVLGQGTRVAGDGPQDPEVFGSLHPTKALDLAAAHVFSAWIWLPSGLDVRSVAAAIGHFSLRAQNADLTIRDAWQRVWVSAKLTPEHRHIVIGLVVHAPGPGRFWSTGWRLEDRPVASAAAQPASMPMKVGAGVVPSRASS